MPLPTNIATSYPDRSAGDQAHQEHHDAIHASVNALDAAYAAAVTGGYAGTKQAWLEQIGAASGANLLSDDETLAGESTTKAPTERAAKAYVDQAVTDGTSGLPIRVSEHSPAGDGLTDDQAAVQAAATAAAAAGRPLLIDGRYALASTVTLPDNSTVLALPEAELLPAAGIAALTVAGDNVSILDVAITGPRAAIATVVDEFAVQAVGTSAADPIRNLRIERLRTSFVGFYGVLLRYVQGFAVADCTITDTGYAGVMAMSCSNGAVENNVIERVNGSGGNGYGIAMTRQETDSLTDDPRCSDVVIRGNVIADVTLWEGIDTHGGERLAIYGNIVTGCKIGIAIGGADNASNVPTWGPRDIDVTNNVIDSGRTDGTAHAGITFTGAPGSASTDPATEYATGSIVGNVIRGHGDETNNIQGAIHLRSTTGVVIASNTIIEPSAFGVCLHYDNRGAVIVGNAVVDAWSDTVSDAAAVACRSNNNDAVIAANTLSAESKAATYINEGGVYNASTTSTLNVGPNKFTGATSAIRGSATGVTATFDAVVSARSGIQANNGNATTPSIRFQNDANTGFYLIADDQVGCSVGGTRRLRLLTSAIAFDEGYNLVVGTTTGTRIGSGATQKLGFWGATPVVRPTGVAVDVAAIHAALVSIGLIAGP